MRQLEVQRPVMRYFGGKWVLAPWIIEHLPKHTIYVEPFGGAASVLMRKDRSYHEVYNDLNQEIVNVFRVLRDETKAPQLDRALRLTPFHRDEYQEAFEAHSDPIEQARRTIIKSFMGFGGDSCSAGKPTGFRSISLSANRGTTPAKEWSTYADCIKPFHDRLKGVTVENRDAFEIMDLHDSVEALFFVDPPYVLDTRGVKHGYSFEMTDQDHARLIARLKEMKAMVVLCGYSHPLYESLGWASVKRETHADGGRDRIEVLWINDAALKAQSQQSLFASATEAFQGSKQDD